MHGVWEARITVHLDKRALSQRLFHLKNKVSIYPYAFMINLLKYRQYSPSDKFVLYYVIGIIVYCLFILTHSHQRKIKREFLFIVQIYIQLDEHVCVSCALRHDFYVMAEDGVVTAESGSCDCLKREL